MPLQGKYTYFLSVMILYSLILIGTGCSKSPEVIKLIVRHIENKDFAEEHVVKFRDEFFISDTDYSAKVIKFIPDFVMNEKTKRVTSRSREMNNPAVLIRVYHKGRFLYDSWVLQKADTIHYVRKPGFYFEFKDYTEMSLYIPRSSLRALAKQSREIATSSDVTSESSQ